MPDDNMVARVAKLETALRNIHAARLRFDGSDPGYGWSLTKLNRAVDEALPLLGLTAPRIAPEVARIAESADGIARMMNRRFVLRDAALASDGREADG